MNWFLLIFTLFYLFTALKSLFKIQTGKEIFDKTFLENPISKKQQAKNIIIITLIVFSIIPIIYLFLCIKFIGSFYFASIGSIYIIWSLYDLSNMITYIQNNKISKTFDNKLYIILSKPFDLGFAIFILYQLFIKWN